MANTPKTKLRDGKRVYYTPEQIQEKTKEWETMESVKNNQINPDKLTLLSNDFL